MVDFANGNLCGASPELNSVLSKLDEAKAEITSKIDEAASTASAAFKLIDWFEASKAEFSFHQNLI